MRTQVSVLGILSLICCCCVADIDQVWRVQLTTDDQVEDLNQLAEKLGIDMWSGPDTAGPTDIHVTDVNHKEIEEKLESLALPVEVLLDDVTAAMDQEAASNRIAKMRNMFRSSYATSVVGTYARHSEIIMWLSNLQRSCSSFCTVQSIGKSYEGRSMKIIRLATGANKPIIFIDAGIHAREWLAPATIIWVLNQLVKDYKSGESEATKLLNTFEFQFLPVVNPDGYDYTFQSRSTRLWRKTRKPYGWCYGADPNRNFDSAFGGPSTSSNPCSDLYHGPKAFSEPETQNLRDHIISIKSRTKLYFSTHTYSQLWLTPYGFTRTPPADNDEIMRVARIGNDALYRTNGIRFEVGSPPNLLYAAAGGSYDWVKQKMGVKYTYTFELRPGRNRGGGGFIAPVSQIVPSGQEIYNAIKATVNAIKY